MKFSILNETKNRLRIHMAQSRMTMAQADILQYYLENCEAVEEVKVHDRTCDAIIIYDGDRAAVIEGGAPNAAAQGGLLRRLYGRGRLHQPSHHGKGAERAGALVCPLSPADRLSLPQPCGEPHALRHSPQPRAVPCAGLRPQRSQRRVHPHHPHGQEPVPGAAPLRRGASN